MKSLNYGIAISLLTLTVACSNQTVTPAPTTTPGLSAVNHKSFIQLAVRPGTDFSQYQRVKIEPLTVAYSDRKRSDQLSRSAEAFEFDDKELAIFNKQFVRALSLEWQESFGWELTEETGADVILVKAAIEDLYLYASIKNDAILPQITITDESSKMTINASLRDSISGDVLFESSSKRKTGWKGVYERTNSVTYWSDANREFRRWASLVGKQLKAAKAD